MKLTTLTIAFIVLALCVAGADEKTKATLKDPKPAAKQTTEAVPGKEKRGKPTPNGKKHPSIWMQQKLKHSQKIFAGMVAGDLFAVEDSARHLKFLNRLENSVNSKDKNYRTQLRVFQYANEEILKGAKAKNLDRVTLGYNQMTLSCVACHKQLRSTAAAGK